MDTKQFLETILPPGSVCLIATREGKAFKHRGFSDFAEAARYVAECDAKAIETYHACAGYKQAPYMLNGKLISRTAINWDCAKAFWCDIDCGAEKAEHGKGYASQKDAVVALFGWCDKVGLCHPMLVNSGNGIHAYWLLDRPIPAEEWKGIAERFKSIMANNGLLIDPTRTADFSSILRPVGTHNHKDPSNPKAVKWVFGGSDKSLVSVDAFKAFVDTYAPETEKKDETYHEPVEHSAVLCADHCKQMAHMRDTQGDVEYEQWRGVIGVIKHCQEGIELARKWSVRREETGHAQTDVDMKYNTWSTGPTTCEFFASHCGADCEGCPHKGRITSPIQLGVIQIKPDPEYAEGVIEGHESRGTVKVEIPAPPKGYEWDGHLNCMVALIKTEDEVLRVPFTTSRLFVIAHIRDEFGHHVCVCRMLFRKTHIRDFRIPCSVITGSNTKLLEELGHYEIVTTNNKNAGALMQAYLKSELDRMKDASEATHTYSHFGWQEDGSFVIGNRRYDKDGNTTEILLSGVAQSKASAFPPPQGSAEEYAKLVNWIYNRDGMEPMQYMICSLWGAPLVKFMEPTYNGIPCALTGADSGKGKTTAAQVALYAFGRAHPDLSLTGARGSTVGGQAKFLGVLRNLPVLFDEVTNKTPAQFSSLCYELSNGAETMRLKSSGGQVGFADREAWRTQTAMTGNSSINAKLSLNGNSEAEMMRIFEICTDALPIPKLDPILTSAKVAQIAEHAGSAGERYLQWLVSHQNEISELQEEVADRVAIDKDLVVQPKYRFYRNHMICTLMAATIMERLGIIQFNLDKLYTFALVAVRECFNQVVEFADVSDPMDVLSSMLTDLSPRIVTTPTFDIPQGREPYKVFCSQGLVGRAIMSNGSTTKDDYDGSLFISTKIANDWCAEHRVPKAKFIQQAKNLGVLKDTSARVSLGIGTTARVSQQRCWVLDLSKLEPTTVEVVNGNRSEQGPLEEDYAGSESDE